MGHFISFEGGEGSGKTTQARRLRDRLVADGYDALLVREPGSTPLGDEIRRWLKAAQPGGARVDGETETLLFGAARAEMVAKIIKPHLAKPRAIVIADRYADSTAAYQGAGRGVRGSHIYRMNAIAVRGLWPDLTFLLDMDPRAGLERLDGGQYGLPLSGAADGSRYDEGGRFEDEPLAFHERVRVGYLRIARADSIRWRVLDAAQSADAIFAHALDEVRGLLRRG